MLAPSEARRLARKLELHFTPKHGSWLNMAEIEIGVLMAQCLDRRIGDLDTLVPEVEAWEARRNAAKTAIQWLFNVDDARRKFARSYPVVAGEDREPVETIVAGC